MNILVQLSGFLPHHGLSFMPAGRHICSFSPPLSPPFAFLPFSSPTLSPRPPFPSVPSNFSYLFFPFEAFSLFSLHFLSFFSPFLSSHPTVVDPRPALCQPHVTTSPMIIIIHLTCSLSSSFSLSITYPAASCPLSFSKSFIHFCYIFAFCVKIVDY